MKRVCLKSAGFTLMELLVVISIIAILASLVIASIGYAGNKAKRDRAVSEIAGLSVALESYKIDNGDYPRDAKTELVNAVTEANKALPNTDALPVSAAQTDLMYASARLYVELSGDTNNDRIGGDKDAAQVKAKVYFQFKPTMFYPRLPAGSTGTAVKALIDPFQNVYGYSTIGSKSGRNDSTEGYNPTFDLWSTADPEQKGKTPPAAWITNW